MAVKAQAMGPGVLTIGAVGVPVDFTAQVTKCAVEVEGQEQRTR